MDLQLLNPSLGKKKMWCWKYDIRHSEIKSSEERSDITGNQILPVFQTPVKKPTMFTAN